MGTSENNLNTSTALASTVVLLVLSVDDVVGQVRPVPDGLLHLLVQGMVIPSDRSVRSNLIERLLHMRIFSVCPFLKISNTMLQLRDAVVFVSGFLFPRVTVVLEASDL